MLPYYSTTLRRVDVAALVGWRSDFQLHRTGKRKGASISRSNHQGAQEQPKDMINAGSLLSGFCQQENANTPPPPFSMPDSPSLVFTPVPPKSRKNHPRRGKKKKDHRVSGKKTTVYPPNLMSPGALLVQSTVACPPCELEMN